MRHDCNHRRRHDYDDARPAARNPWAGGANEPGTEAVPTLALDRALHAIEASEVVEGAFLWKWFLGPVRRETFLVSTPTMRAVIAARWQGEP